MSAFPIADVRSVDYTLGSMRYIVIAALTVLCGCGSPSNTNTHDGDDRNSGSTRLPFDNSSGFLNGYFLRIPRTGDFLWNGAPVDQAILTTYLRQWAALPRSAGHLFVAFEPGTPQPRAEWVRKQVMDSGLCKQRRCAEVGWDVIRPVVN